MFLNGTVLVMVHMSSAEISWLTMEMSILLDTKTDMIYLVSHSPY